MKIENINQAMKLASRLEKLNNSYELRFKNKRNSLRVTISLDNGHNFDLTPVDSLDMDLSMDGPIAAIVDQADRQKIAQVKKELQALGIEI